MKHNLIARIKKHRNKPDYIINGKPAYRADLVELAESVENKETGFNVNGVSIKASEIIAQKPLFKRSNQFFWIFMISFYVFAFSLLPVITTYGNITILLLISEPVILIIVYFTWYIKYYRMFGDKFLLRQEGDYSQEMLQKVKENEKVNGKNGNVG